MTTYAWVGRTRAGQIVSGERAAESGDALTAALRREQILGHQGRARGQEGGIATAACRDATWRSSRASSRS